MATCNPNELVQAGKCFVGVPGPQREAMMLVLLCRILQANNPMATCDVNELMQDAKCFAGLPLPQMLAIQTQILCEILQGGSGGQTCIVCLDDDATPTDPATCACSIAYNMIGQFWFWNSLTSSWLPISV